MKHLCALVMVLLLAGSLVAAETVVLPELLNPDAVNVDGKHIVINQDIHVLVYSREKVKLLTKFGKPGEGPGEFKQMPLPWMPSLYLFLQPDNLCINSMGKVSVYTREGKLVKELKGREPFNVFIPFEKNYIAVDIKTENNRRFVTYNVHALNLDKEKEIFRTLHPSQPGKKDNPLVMAVIKNLFLRQATWKNLFLPTPEGNIHVFDASGKEGGVIKPAYPEVSFTSKDKQAYDTYFSTTARFKEIYARERANIGFPSRYPAMKDYRIDGDKLYLITSRRKGKNTRVLIYGLDGKLSAGAYIPLEQQDLLEVYPFDIHDGKLYQLMENEDEEWVLRVTEIK